MGNNISDACLKGVLKWYNKQNWLSKVNISPFSSPKDSSHVLSWALADQFCLHCKSLSHLLQIKQIVQRGVCGEMGSLTLECYYCPFLYIRSLMCTVSSLCFPLHTFCIDYPTRFSNFDWFVYLHAYAINITRERDGN